ncbi:uncharacterized protein N7459_003173 [Penicillium hispanicum]|uniref:uncharacterized protein n=1 Tax=Penicillium hispanicum TaxID=1080232 RepID=UPI0025412545|nr:uncharacterized protein N7459_003173 [Penicillium hispanicum]KAJ5587408.1 hypothetical protein N7459_003173 [Penicillium hispanicum]
MSNSPNPSEVTLTDGEKVLEKYHSTEMGSASLDSRRPIDLEAQAPNAEGLPKRFAGLRYTIFSIYRRLFTLVFLANVGVFVAVMVSDRKLLALVNATAANLLACGLARQPLVVNAIFLVVCSLPRSAPMPVRRLAAKVYHYGGVHSGCGIAALVWYIGFVGLLSHIYWTPSATNPASPPAVSISAAPVAIAYLILVLLVLMTAVAYPTFRVKRHDYFELTHRFTAWLVVALFVALLMVFAHEVSRAQHESLGRFLVTLPAFWFLMVTVIAIVHPWSLLRKVPVRAERLSTHAVRLHFEHTKVTFGKGLQVSKQPLRDWHSFATFPDPSPTGPQQSFSCLVSKAGDWTADTIQNPPTHLWKRGVPIFGVAYAMRVFQRVLLVTTGSGIGPCLSFLGDDSRPFSLRVIWQTRAPLKTYGPGVMELVRRMDSDPIIMDTDRDGRVDMLPIVKRQVKAFQAEAVCVISNPKTTCRIVYELEARGIPAYGPIFDS